MELQKINNAINFRNELRNQYQELLLFLNRFNEIYIKEEEKLPYHINIIDELHANENAHSRILEKLLKQQEPKHQKYEILESFIKYIINKNKNHEDFCKIKIKNPKITQEKKRIDLWIRDNDYAIIIENKVGCACDQTSQLERYIDITKEYNFKEKQIYVLYLPPTYEKKPNEQTWGKYYEKDIYKKRYLNLSFRDDILPWLKEVPPIKNNRFLSSSIEQYIDHLEGMFSLRKINNDMNNNLQYFIKKELEINEVEPETAIKIVAEKQQEMENAITQLESIQKELRAKIDEKYFSNCQKELKELNLNVIRKIDSSPEYYPRSVGVKLDNNLTVWLGKEEDIDAILFCQVNYDNRSEKFTHTIRQKFKEILGEKNIEEDDKDFLIWKRIQNGNALTYLKEICKKMSSI